MATRTVSNAGGNWSVTTTWVGGVVPIAGDDIAFTATSGNLTVNVNTAVLIGVNFTNYLGTITFTQFINTNGFLNLGTGGYTQAGANGIVLNNNTTLTSGGVTWSRTLTFGGTSATYTFVGNWTSTGLITFSAGGTTTLTNNTLNINGSLTQSAPGGTYAGTTAIVFGGTGTWSNSSTGAIRNNTTINTAGTLTISGNIYYNTGTFTYTAGTVVTTGSTLNISLLTTLATNGMSWNNVTLSGSTYTITLSNNLTIGGDFIFSNTGTSTITMNGNTMNIGGNFTITGNSLLTGTTNIILNGTGTWSNSSTGIIRNNLTFNNGVNTFAISGNVYYNTGTITYTSGTIDTTGSTLNIGVATTLNTNGITWNNINTTTGVVITLGSNLTLTGTLSIGTGTTSFVLGGFNLISTNSNLTMGASSTFTLPANQTFKTLTITGSAIINTNILTITENLTINNPVSGTTTILYAGTGTWTGTSAISNILTINTAGTLTISGNVYKFTGLFTYTAGTIIDTTGTVNVQALTLNLSGFTFRKLLVNGAITLTSNLNATTFGTWSTSPVSFILGAFSLNFTHLELGNTNSTTLPTNWTAQNVELSNPTSAVVNTNSITVTGNLIQSGGGLVTGTTTFTYAVPVLSTGTWSRTGIGRLQNNLTINSAGTIDFTGGQIGGGIFIYTAGTVNVQVTSTLYNGTSGTTFNGAGITWYNVVFGTPTSTTSVSTVTLNTQLICLGTLTLQNSDTVFSGTDGTFDTYDFVLGTTGNALRTTQLISTKTYRVRQSFTCTQATNIGQILLRSTIGGSQAIFTLDSGSTIDVGFVNATDIDSSLGRPVYSYKGVFSNTLNWSLLPVDVTTTAFTFIS